VIDPPASDSSQDMRRNRTHKKGSLNHKALNKSSHHTSQDFQPFGKNKDHMPLNDSIEFDTYLDRRSTRKIAIERNLPDEDFKDNTPIPVSRKQLVSHDE
jgi:hypothetical protein